MKVFETNKISGVVEGKALTTSFAEIPYTVNDSKTAIVMINSDTSAVNVTFEKGDGVNGVADLVASVPSGVSFIALDSDKFKFVSGAVNATEAKAMGYIKVKAATASKVTAYVIELP